jgi:hypothetical protein
VVAYQPPDGVTLMVGASFRAADLACAARRIAPLLQRDAAQVFRFGLEASFPSELVGDADELERALLDPLLKKNDTPLQMSVLTELFAEIRLWLGELRDLAQINLILDRPALVRAVSPLLVTADGYPRDVLHELEDRVAAAKDLRPRLEDVGLDERFLGRGRKLLQQLHTAIGREDIQGDNLAFKVRRFYGRKGQLHTKLKRATAIARAQLRAEPARAAAYHLVEFEPDRGPR